MIYPKGITKIQALILVAIVVVFGVATSILISQQLVKPVSKISQTPVTSLTPSIKTVVDQMGREVKIPTKVNRVITLATDIAEITWLVGAGDKIVGGSNYVKYDEYLPERIRNVTVVGKWTAVNVETVASLNPDVMIVEYSSKVEDLIKSVEKICPVVVIWPKTIEDIPETIRLIGEVTGGEKAEELASWVEQKINYVKDIVSSIPDHEKPTVLLVSASSILKTKGKTVTVYARGSAWGSLINFVGGINVAWNITEPWPKVSLETILKWNPDKIIVLGWRESQANEAKEAILSDPNWQVLKAVKNGEVYTIIAGSRKWAWLSWSPRCVVGLFQLAKIVQPKYFSEINWEEIANELLTKYYGEKYHG